MNKNSKIASSLRLVSGVSDSHLEELQRSRMLNWTYFKIKESETEFWTLISKLKKAKRQVQISISKEAERTSQTFKSKVKEAENKFQTSISKNTALWTLSGQNFEGSDTSKFPK
ncbi:unnamed protein product [Rhizophagus irregularis]|nr:unnamed protein product [Rhizophagus irregularis]